MQIKIFTLVMVIVIAFSLQSFKPNIIGLNTGGTDTLKTKTNVESYKVYFGCDGELNKNGIYPKDKLLQASKNKLCVKEANSNKAIEMYSFDFTYCERGVFEDSTGLPTIVTDYNYAPLYGDSITSNWQRALTERLYKGDTIRIDNVIIKNNGKLVKLNQKLKLVAQ